MVLSNAERQRRWRERQKERASSGAGGAQARAAVMAATEALWGYYKRKEAEGEPHGDLDGIASLDEFRTSFATPFKKRSNRNEFVEMCRIWTDDPGDMTAEEIAPLKVIVEIDDALRLRGNVPE